MSNIIDGPVTASKSWNEKVVKFIRSAFNGKINIARAIHFASLNHLGFVERLATVTPLKKIEASKSTLRM